MRARARAGVIIDNFNRIKAESDGSATMTAGQAQWAETMKTMAHQQASRIAKPPANAVRMAAFRLVSSTPFDVVLTSVIIANVGGMACDYWGIEDNPRHIAVYSGCMTVFSYIYYLEFVLKLTALGPRQYFSDHWCGPSGAARNCAIALLRPHECQPASAPAAACCRLPINTRPPCFAHRPGASWTFSS